MSKQAKTKTTTTEAKIAATLRALDAIRGKDATRPELGGVHVAWAEDGTVTLRATDGHCGVRVTLPADAAGSIRVTHADMSSERIPPLWWRVDSKADNFVTDPRQAAMKIELRDALPLVAHPFPNLDRVIPKDGERRKTTPAIHLQARLVARVAETIARLGDVWGDDEMVGMMWRPATDVLSPIRVDAAFRGGVEVIGVIMPMRQ